MEKKEGLKGRVIFRYGGLFSGWSFVMAVCPQGGLFFMVVSPQDGLSLRVPLYSGQLSTAGELMPSVCTCFLTTDTLISATVRT